MSGYTSNPRRSIPSEPFVPKKSSLPSPRCPTARLADREQSGESRILEERILGIGRLAIILERKAAAARRNRRGPLHLHGPLHDIDVVRAQVGHLAAGVIPEPAEMVKRAVRIVGPLGRRAEPHVVIEIVGRCRVGRRAETRHDVAERAHARADHFADISRPAASRRPSDSAFQSAAACPPALRACIAGRPQSSTGLRGRRRSAASRRRHPCPAPQAMMVISACQ